MVGTDRNVRVSRCPSVFTRTRPVDTGDELPDNLIAGQGLPFAFAIALAVLWSPEVEHVGNDVDIGFRREKPIAELHGFRVVDHKRHGDGCRFRLLARDLILTVSSAGERPDSAQCRNSNRQDFHSPTNAAR